MKKLFPLFVIITAVACNTSSTTTVANGDTDTMVTATMPSVDTTSTAMVYTPVEGDVIFKDGHAMVMRGGNWVAVDHDITLDNGVVVHKTGAVTRDKVTIQMKEGEVVNKTGNFFDRTGKAIDNAWQDTKDAVGDAGRAVGKTAKKVGKKIDTVFSGKHR